MQETALSSLDSCQCHALGLPSLQKRSDWIFMLYKSPDLPHFVVATEILSKFWGRGRISANVGV